MLSNETMNDIEMFENIINNIYESYRKLSELECKKLKESKEYAEELENLKRYLEFENNILERFKASREFEGIISYIEHKYNTLVGVNINFSGEKIDIIKARICNDLNSVRLSQNANSKDFSSALYIAEIYNDMLKLALAILENNKHINDEVEKIKIKYRTSLCLRKIEKEFVSTNFEVNCSPYIGSDLLCMDETEKSFGEIIKITEVGNFFPILAANLIGDDNRLLQDSSKLQEIIFNSCIIRAAFVLIPEEFAETLKQKLIPYMIRIDGKPGRKITYDLQYEATHSRYMDREIPKYLSFGR